MNGSNAVAVVIGDLERQRGEIERTINNLRQVYAFRAAVGRAPENAQGVPGATQEPKRRQGKHEPQESRTRPVPARKRAVPAAGSKPAARTARPNHWPAVEAALKGAGSLSVDEIAKRVGAPAKELGKSLCYYATTGRLNRVGIGIYSLPKAAAAPESRHRHKVKPHGGMFRCGDCFEERETVKEFTAVPCEP